MKLSIISIEFRYININRNISLGNVVKAVEDDDETMNNIQYCKDELYSGLHSKN
jgi:hypothetical protein